jgi:hypothetical protein
MFSLTRRQILLSKKTQSLLDALAKRYGLSETEIVSRAIQAFDSEQYVVAPSDSDKPAKRSVSALRAGQYLQY